MSNEILSIKVENKRPIELNQLTLSLNALACQYCVPEYFDFWYKIRRLINKKIWN